MKSIVNWFTKNKILLSSFIATILFSIFYFNIPYNYICKPNLYLESCGEILKFFKIILIISPALLFFSIITLKTKEELFWKWRKFTFIYLCIYLFIATIFPWYIGDEFLNIQKAHVSIFMVMIYSIISLILIFYKSLKKN